MSETFRLPDLGEGLQEAELVRWHVAVGDRVAVDQPMVAVETAKAVVEVPVPFTGVVQALHGEPGDVVQVGAPLVEIETDEAAQPSRPDAGSVVGVMPTSDEDYTEAPAAMPISRPGTATPATATAAATAEAATSTATPAAATASAAAATSTAAPAATSAAASSPLPPSDRQPRVRASPAVRALAKRLGVDLASLHATGRYGLVTLDDVLDATPHETPAVRASQPAAAPEKLHGPRRAMADAMALSRDQVTPCTLFDDADVHRWEPDTDYTARLLHAIAAACAAVPALNAWYDGERQERRLHDTVDVAVAVDTEHGLLVPVVRDVGALPPPRLRAELDRLKRAARERTLAAADLRDFTFMLSNFGTLAGRYATPVIVPPAVAILGTGRMSHDVVAVVGGIEARRRLPLSLTFDHRCVTGGEAARFLAALVADLQHRD